MWEGFKRHPTVPVTAPYAHAHMHVQTHIHTIHCVAFSGNSNSIATLNCYFTPLHLYFIWFCPLWFLSFASAERKMWPEIWLCCHKYYTVISRRTATKKTFCGNLQIWVVEAREALILLTRKRSMWKNGIFIVQNALFFHHKATNLLIYLHRQSI